ncbi:alpha/beta hydrolase [Pseudalkalibacillus hwajinpoensis]|uniref:alpha/beta fold hydrolase n=1 Tax=Guptibacillus hwajinpoensis TaxID=208199 RepID=UPI00325B297A
MLDYQYHHKYNKETIVLLHGLGGNTTMFHKQMDAYKKHFDVLAINLPGHGNSPCPTSYTQPFSFAIINNEILDTLDTLNIKRAHFVGISVGAIVVHDFLQRNPERAISAVLGGCITRYNAFSAFLLFASNLLKNVIPHMLLYKVLAHIIMPRNNHKISRDFFVREAQKIDKSRILPWVDLVQHVRTTYVDVQKNSKNVPKLYISGAEDHLFVKAILEDTKKDQSSERLILEKCGHVCNLEKPREFNDASLKFIGENKRNEVQNYPV